MKQPPRLTRKEKIQIATVFNNMKKIEAKNPVDPKLAAIKKNLEVTFNRSYEELIRICKLENPNETE